MPARSSSRRLPVSGCPRSSTPIRAAGSRPKTLLRPSCRGAAGCRWTAKAPGMTRSSSSGCGEPSSTSGSICGPATASVLPSRILRSSSTGTTPSGLTAAWMIKRRTRPTGHCHQRCRWPPRMKILGVPRVARRGLAFVVSEARRRGQFCFSSTRPLSLNLLG
jgi:hypothetical protein